MLPRPVVRSGRGMFRVARTMAHMVPPTRLTWKQLSPRPDAAKGIPCERSSHGISFVHSEAGSRLIVYGGENIARTSVDPSQALWAADVQDDSWSWRALSCDGPAPRVAHAQAAVRSSVYIFGGRCGIAMDEKPLNDLWVLDCDCEPGRESWSKVQLAAGSDDPPEPRSFHRMIAVSSDLYVFGGCGTSGRLADLHKFDTVKKTWHNLGKSNLLRGRGGPNLLHLKSDRLAVIAGFAGEETNDGHAYDLKQGAWETSALGGLTDLRPRSVCIAISLPGDKALIFGGEVNPSDLGHEGAGGFENDVAVLDGTTGALLSSIPSSSGWPVERGWADGAAGEATKGLTGRFYVFGGLTGDDQNPKRLNDLWQCDVE